MLYTLILVSELSADKIVGLFERDVRARKRLAELFVTEPDVRLALINAIIGDVATKEDLEKLRAATKEDIEKLRVETREDIERLRAATREEIAHLEARIGSLESRVSRLEGQMSLFIRLFIAFNVPTLVGIIGILLKMLFT